MEEGGKAKKYCANCIGFLHVCFVVFSNNYILIKSHPLPEAKKGGDFAIENTECS